MCSITVESRGTILYTPMIQIKRVYEAPEKADGQRILVDRLWPRGVSKEHAKIDRWVKELAPSAKLRKWFNHDPEKWPQFKAKYREELERNKSIAVFIKELKQEATTFVYAASDTQHNNAVVLKEYLENYEKR